MASTLTPKTIYKFTATVFDTMILTFITNNKILTEKEVI